MALIEVRKKEGKEDLNMYSGLLTVSNPSSVETENTCADVAGMVS